MQHLLTRLWIAITISALAIEHSHPAIAKPKSKFTASHIAEGVTAPEGRLKQLNHQMVAISTARQVILAKKTTRTVKGVRRVKIGENKSPNGLSNLTNTDPDRDDRSSPVNRLIK
jgi:hypothetical protein